MSPYLKSALILVPVTPVIMLLQLIFAFHAVAATGAGGLGAVSFGLSETVITYVTLTAIVWVLVYWRARVRARGSIQR